MSEQKSEYFYDVVIVGSGAGALTTAITAADQGLKPIIIEKSDVWGGSSAMSGGGVWIPNNPVSNAYGVKDSAEEALTYLEEVIEDVGPASSRARKEAFVKYGPEMVSFLQDKGITWYPGMEYPDYYPDKPGGKIGRSLDTKSFDLKKLGDIGKTLRRAGILPVPVRSGEVAHLPKAFTKPRHFFKVISLFMRGFRMKMLGQNPVALGGALVSNLMYIVQQYNVPVWLNSPMKSLVLENDKVVGVTVERDGKQLTIKGDAVLLAAGGFASNSEFRKKYQKVGREWTSANPDNTGDIVQEAINIGADMALMDDAWWGPSAVQPNGAARFILWERSMPHTIIVDHAGKRYLNESESYVDAGHHMFERDEHERAIPSWLILDTQNRNKYIFGEAMPRFTPKKMIDNGFFTKADTLDELAKKCGINADGLKNTVERFNTFVEKGVDEDFERGRTAYDNYYGDPSYKNPNLGSIAKAPFYAVKLYPGDLGTKGGMVTDEYGRVLKNGKPIDGLYATGNCTASVMGRTYPGPGSTLGPAVTFGYIAMHHVSSQAKKQQTDQQPVEVG
ncbi:FAD-binding protein [Radiobacillus sp. PE A8.2]|uniref:FAD-binding protein n=1 Tax=Radiobacillus sp. PE A8.2 TaxID=3380349 RepID=UPI00388CF7AE